MDPSDVRPLLVPHVVTARRTFHAAHGTKRIEKEPFCRFWFLAAAAIMLNA